MWGRTWAASVKLVTYQLTVCITKFLWYSPCQLVLRWLFVLYSILHAMPVYPSSFIGLSFSLKSIALSPASSLAISIYTRDTTCNTAFYIVYHLYTWRSYIPWAAFYHLPSVHMTTIHTPWALYFLPFTIRELMTLVHAIIYSQCGSHWGLPQL